MSKEVKQGESPILFDKPEHLSKKTSDINWNFKNNLSLFSIWRNRFEYCMIRNCTSASYRIKQWSISWREETVHIKSVNSLGRRTDVPKQKQTTTTTNLQVSDIFFPSLLTNTWFQLNLIFLKHWTNQCNLLMQMVFLRQC